METKKTLEVVLIEDNKADSRFIKELLREEEEKKYSVISAPDLKSGLKTFSDRTDIVLLDLSLPDSFGLETVKKAFNVIEDTPIIVLTGLDDKDIAIDSLKLGAQDYLVKNKINPELLKKSIDYALERQNVETALKESKESYKILVDNIQEGIWRIDKYSNTVFVNKRMTDMLGYSPEEMLGKHLFNFMDEEQKKICTKLLERRKKGIKEDHRFKFLSKDKKDVYVLMETTPILDKKGQYDGAIAYINDITKQRLTEEALRESELQFDSFMKNLPACAYIKDVKGRYIFLNKYYKKILNINNKKDLEGITDFDLWPAETAKSFKKDDEKIINKNKKIEVIEKTLSKSQNKKNWYLTTKFPINSSNGKPMLGGVSIDITELKEAEKEISAIEEQYRNLFENSRDGIYKTSIDGNYITVNSALVKMLGYSSKAELMSINVKKDLYLKSSNRPGSSERNRLFETSFKKKDGSIIDVEISSNVVYENNKVVGFEGIVRDISERKKTLKKLDESYKRIKKNLEDVIKALVSIVEIRDPYTAGHQKRVANLSERIAISLGFDQLEIENIKTAALIHDIGKITIPASILSKPGKISNTEMLIVQTHPEIGAKTVEAIDFGYPVDRIILQHHERENGSGYPKGLKSDEILLGAKIIAVSDVIEAMSSHRPYRPALGIDKAFEELKMNKGKLYDKRIVEACIDLFENKGFKFP